MALAALLLTPACTDEDPAPPARPETSPSPASGGRLVFGVVGEPPTLEVGSPLASDLTRALAELGVSFRVTKRVPGLGLVYAARGRVGKDTHLGRIVVRYIQTIDIALELLDRGRLDAAALPATVNLPDRVRERGLQSALGLGHELVYLDFRGSDFSTPVRTALAALSDPPSLERAFVRELGRVSQTLHPDAKDGGVGGPFRGLGTAETPAGGRTVQLAAPVGDELLSLVQRALHDDWEEYGFSVDLVTIDARTFYGEWAARPQVDVALRRGMSTELPPDRAAFRTMDVVPLFQTASVIAWRDGVHGIEPPTGSHGPFWNARRWWIAR